MEKKNPYYCLMILLLFLVVPLVSAESIVYYKVPSSVPLNQGITATGFFVPDNNMYANKLCSFYFLDSQNNPIIRASDYYTDATGRFFLPPYTITEPLFQRDQNYLLMTTCGTATATSNFLIGQKQEALDLFGLKIYPQAFTLDLMYFKDPNNSMTIFYMIVFAIMAIITAYIFAWALFFRNK